MKTTALVSALCLAALTVCGAASGTPATTTATTTGAAGAISWRTCTGLTGPDGKPAAPDPTLQCGKLAVPLDYAKPGGERIDLALIRVKATGDRLGSLVFNFGGPGGSGVDTLAMAARAFAALGTRYDLVSFDPRGVERSAGVRCGGDVETILNASDGASGDKAVKKYVAACRKDSGKVLPYVGTINAARDMDRIRAALGDAKLNYFGLSYGTQLGAVYATHFPRNTGRLVLDAAYDPTGTFADRAVIQATGFATSFDAFAKDCVAKGCDLGQDPAEVRKTVETFVDGLRDKPIKVGKRSLTHALGQLGVITPLYAKASWPLLEQAVAAAVKGDGTMLLALADTYTGRRADGTYTTTLTSMQAITCADTSERPTRAQAAAVNRKIKKIFPVLATSGTVAPCAHWPVPGDDRAKRIDATGSAPIMVVGAKGDPATPYRWATSLTARLRTGVLLTYEGEGHGAYLSGSACVAQHVNTYLLTGKLPARDTSCPAT
ncbi:alpha/beta hydrolase [Nonomuraea sp. 3-1Str]|uniref:alpha/beta hydrolase n=1 Tax=Nonomuraea sp. 3-1Str TaxID=2929801 RepID=UPI00285AFFF9|nr:alpha/beta hydrolase [Nonomuraea sp. 3-1Str]MDR8414518.1 alpha/beta hydrolase [Nonomuraea sp. 3-1Str]